MTQEKAEERAKNLALEEVRKGSGAAFRILVPNTNLSCYDQDGTGFYFRGLAYKTESDSIMDRRITFHIYVDFEGYAVFNEPEK